MSEKEIQPETPPTESAIGSPTLNEIELREKIRQELLPQIRQEYQDKFEEAKKEFQETLRKGNDETLRKALDEYKRQHTPPTKEEVQQMLDAEYLEFEVKVRMNGESKRYILAELPASSERKFLRILKDKLGPHVRDLVQLVQNIQESEFEENVDSFFRGLDPGADLLHETVALILTESADGQVVTAEEVRKSLSLSRQLMIVNAQASCNRIRDFFSSASRMLVQ